MVAQFMDVVYETLSFSWFEVSFVLCFILGFAFLRLDLFSCQKKVSEDDYPRKSFDSKLKQAIDAGAPSNRILAAWRSGCAEAPTPPAMLRQVVHALLECEPASLQDELAAHIRQHDEAMRSARTANIALDAVARAGNIKVMGALRTMFWEQFRIRPNLQTFEVLIGGYATDGDEKGVAEVCAEVSALGLSLTPRGLSLAIKGFLKNGMVDATLAKFEDMRKLGYQLPPFAVTQLLRVACNAGRGREVFASVRGLAKFGAESVTVLLEACSREQDMAFAREVERDARAEGVTFTFGIYDSLLKLYTVKGDPKVLMLFADMQQSSVRITEGLCAALLTRCAEAKFLRFAVDIVKHARATCGMSIAMYSALMKVYAFCDMYGKACDLYTDIRNDGLEPDAMMYGCLMKFAVECGRTELSRELAEMAPSLEIQNYMSLIRAAGRDKDVARAFKVLDRLKASNVPIDAAVHNCVLDVCVSAGDIQRAHELVAEMRRLGFLDVITYNTLIKGHCYMGDLAAAKACMEEMAKDGIKPNDISFNCLLNACVHAGGGSFREAWATIDRMRASGVKIDHFTISIMMKALKRVNNPRDVSRSLELLDQANIDVCSDEILLNSVLETCTRHQESRRLQHIINLFSKSNLRASVSTYGSLIKACGSLKNVPQCWAYWRAMEERGLEPTPIALGCMLDALVCNGDLEQAEGLLIEWKQKGRPANAIMYSTLIKGYASSGQHSRAMETLHLIRADGEMKLTTAVYNSVIDAQARAGSMTEIYEVLDMMKADGVTPDSISWATIVKGHCVQGDLNQAFEVFKSRVAVGSSKDSMLYNNILDGCIRHARFDLAESLVEQMETTKVVPSNYTFGILVKLYARRRQVDKAFEVIERLSKQFHITPNNQVRTCLMCACLNANSPAKALQVFEELRASPSGADAKAYSSLISGLLRHRKTTEAVKMVEEAYGLEGAHCLPKGQNIEVDVLEKLITALGQKGLNQTVAVPLLERLRGAGAPVGGRIYSSLIGGGMTNTYNNKDNQQQHQHKKQYWGKDRR